ncbi:unnamed protein product [Phytophthora lilii]|uniref:Unnamed protein product n=1 Tax=Phytophthora lilii TaxID=2077276 RepID=A0A9W6U5P9_9STRA|nr:unnamed protein product [Phytophthora lilii]
MPLETTKLEYLQGLSSEGKTEELQSAVSQCSCKELRSLIGILGVPVRSKEYAIYNNKAGYVDLLMQILTCTMDQKLETTSTRKSKKCNLRLANVIFGEALATIVDGLNAEPAQTVLDSEQFVPEDPFWEKVRAGYAQSNEEYSRVVFQDNCFREFDLAVPVHHTSEKLWKMWRELCTTYISAAARFERSDRPDTDFFEFCQNRADVYYLRCWLNVKPHLLVSVNGKLPTGAENGSTRSNNEDAVGELTSRNLRKRPIDGIGSIRGRMQPDKYAMSPKYQQRAELLKLIKQATEALTTIRELDNVEEVEEVVHDELMRYTKLLKRSQQEETAAC